MGALQGYSIGSSAGNMLDPPKLPTQNVSGPRLTDLTVQMSVYGNCIPRDYGMVPSMGNMIWLENGEIKEIPTTVSQTQGGKGGGGGQTTNTTTYAYNGTFAIGLCEGQIAGISRIWIGPKLWFDKSATASAAALAQSDSLVNSGALTIYTGSETQMPDARMQATLGIDDTPAYRGLAYIVIADLALKDFGNSLMGAQVKVEIIKDAMPSVPAISEFSITAGDGDGGMTYDAASNSIWYVNSAHNSVSRFDVATSLVTHYAIFAPVALCIDPVHAKVWVSGNGTISTIEITTGVIHENLGIPGLTGNNKIVFDSITQSVWLDGFAFPYTNLKQINTSTLAVNTFPVAQTVRALAFDPLTGSVWFCPSPGTMIRKNATNGIETPFALQQAGIAQNSIFEPVTGSIWVQEYDWITKINCQTGVAVSYANTGFVGGSGISFDAINNKICLTKPVNGIINIDIFTGVITDQSFAPARTFWKLSYDSINSSNWGIEFGVHKLTRLNLSTPILADTVPISTIITSEVAKCGLLNTAVDLDVSLLTSRVRGFRISNVAPVRSSVEPLQAAFPFDFIQHGYKIKAIPRGNSSIVNIDWRKLDARGNGQQEGVQLTSTREMDLILPKKVAIKHLDVNREYDIGEQYAERLNTDAVNVKTMDLALCLTPTECAQKAEMLLYLYWLERYDLSFKLSQEFNYLEPSDVITITTATNSFELRLTTVHYTSDGRVECTARYNRSQIYTPVAVSEASVVNWQQLEIIGPTKTELLDLPAMSDLGAQVGFSSVLYSDAAGWRGGALYSSIDGGMSWSVNFEASGGGEGVVFTADTALGVRSVPQCAVIREDDTLIITPASFVAQLSSITELQMLAGGNHFAYGADGRWEIIAAKNAILSGGKYTLSSFMRGRFGTEHNTGLHQPGDKLVLLATQSVVFLHKQTSSIGSAVTYRPVTLGALLASGIDQSFTYRGENLKPLSPVYLGGWRDANFDWNFNWTRRTRLGGELRDGVGTMLSEASESYIAEIFDATFAVLLRTLLATSPSVVYTAAMQEADFGVGIHPATINLKVFQMSETVGRGNPLIETITRE